jgi:hypothetical protein
MGDNEWNQIIGQNYYAKVSSPSVVLNDQRFKDIDLCYNYTIAIDSNIIYTCVNSFSDNGKVSEWGYNYSGVWFLKENEGKHLSNYVRAMVEDPFNQQTSCQPADKDIRFVTVSAGTGGDNMRAITGMIIKYNLTYRKW